MTPRLVLTNHAAQRLAERFGWSGDRAAAEDAINAMPAVRAYLALGGMGEAQIVAPQIDMMLGINNGVVCTVLVASQRYGRRNDHFNKGAREDAEPVPGHVARHASRRRRSADR